MRFQKKRKSAEEKNPLQGCDGVSQQVSQDGLSLKSKVLGTTPTAARGWKLESSAISRAPPGDHLVLIWVSGLKAHGGSLQSEALGRSILEELSGEKKMRTAGDLCVTALGGEGVILGHPLGLIFQAQCAGGSHVNSGWKYNRVTVCETD